MVTLLRLTVYLPTFNDDLFYQLISAFSSRLLLKMIQTSNNMHVYTGSSNDLDRQIEQLRQCEIITEQEVKTLCCKAREILIEESNVQRVDSPVTVSSIIIIGN